MVYLFAKKRMVSFLVSSKLLYEMRSKASSTMIFSSPNFIQIFKKTLTDNRSVAIIIVTERLLLFKE